MLLRYTVFVYAYYNGNCLANLEFKVVGGIQKILQQCMKNVPGSCYVEVT